MSEDVIMKDVATTGVEADSKLKYQDYKKNMMNMDRAVSLKDIRGLAQSLRHLNNYRKNFSDEDLTYLIDVLLRQNHEIPNILQLNDEARRSAAERFLLPTKLVSKMIETPEFIIFHLLLVLLKYFDRRQYNEAFGLVQHIISLIKKHEGITFQHLRAKAYYNLCLIAEKIGNYDSIMNELNATYRKACIEFDEITQVTLINCIVRYYIINNAYEKAGNFLSKTKFFENVSTHEDARYFYYLGRINCIQMNYGEAFKHLTNSIRKAPETCGLGFKTVAQKLLIIVELLMGEVPDINKYFIANKKYLEALHPYFNLIKAVQRGDLEEFKRVITTHERTFIADKNYNVIQRLRHVVIKIGLRKINLSYSRISLADINEKLKLESERETEYITQKAIRDGVFLAVINHDEGYVQSKDIEDIYNTFEPQKAFHRRILFLNKIHNDAHKALKYAEKPKKDTGGKELEEDDNAGIMDSEYMDF